MNLDELVKRVAVVDECLEALIRHAAELSQGIEITAAHLRLQPELISLGAGLIVAFLETRFPTAMSLRTFASELAIIRGNMQDVMARKLKEAA